jgi:conjugal transfer pilus assembly protein TraL
MQQVKIPQYVDEPVHVLIWSVDDVAPIILGLFAGIIAGSPAMFVLGGVALSFLYRKFRDVSSDGLAMHFLYWHGLIPTETRTAPNSHSRIYLP